MKELESVLTAAASLIKPGGRLAVMSYHSLEVLPLPCSSPHLDRMSYDMPLFHIVSPDVNVAATSLCEAIHALAVYVAQAFLCRCKTCTIKLYHQLIPPSTTSA